MQEHEAGDRWKIVREKKKMETTRPEFEINCSECGRTEIVSRLPRHGEAYVCQRCKQEQAIPDKTRLEGAESVDGLLKVRRKKK
jgi:ribosomal protein L37AE/L43A